MALWRKLAEITLDQVTGFGDKAARLGEAMALGCPVLPGVVLSTDLYRLILGQGGLEGEISSILSSMQPTALAQFQAVEWAIRSAFSVRKLPAEVTSAISECWDALGGVPLVVRSSATWEDSPEHSFVGQHESFVHVRDEAALARAALGCWVSLFSAKALSYAQRFGVDLTKASMAVLLQPMIEPSAQGELYNVDPITGNPDVFVLQVEQGPDAGIHHLDPYERSPGEWPHWSALRRYGLLLGERLLNYQALEWAVSDERLYLLRARPVTSVPNYLPAWPLHAELTAGPLLLQRPARITARALRPYSQYDRSLAPRLGQAAFQDASRFFSPFAGREEVFACGYLYTRMRRFPLQSGLRSRWRLRRAMQGLQQISAARKLDHGFWDLWRSSQPTLRRLGTLPLAEMRGAELGDALDQAVELEESFWVRHGQLGHSDQVLADLLYSLHRRWLGSSTQEECRTLAYACSDPVEASYAALCELARTPFPSAEEREAAVQQHLAQNRHLLMPGDLLEERHGVREIDQALLAVRALVERLTDVPEATTYCEQQAREADRIEKIEARLLSALGPARRGIYSYMLGLVRRYAPARKACQSAILACRLVQHDIALEGGRRMCAEGLMAEPAEAFHLTHSQMSAHLRGKEARDVVMRAILTNKTEERRWWRYSPPDRIEASAESAQNADDYAVDIQLTGQPISPGTATGPARLINTLGEATSIVPGEILLCHRPLFELTSLFDMAAAVVTEAGSLLDHAGVMAREYGIPAIFGVEGLTDRISNGDELVVDANRGVVERIEPEIDWLDF